MSFKDNSDNLSWKTINVLKISESIPYLINENSFHEMGILTPGYF